ncbi:MAG: DUF4340 domain-containing protein [Phycisphaeraceae bacterium]
MNIKTTIALLVILAGIGLYFLLMEKAKVNDPHTEEKKSTNIFSAEQLYPEGVRIVTISSSLGERARITRDEDGTWMQVEPVSFPLNPISMHNGLTYKAATIKFTDKFTPGKDGKPTLSQMNLDNPLAMVTFEGAYRDAQLIDGGQDSKVSVTPFKTTIKFGSAFTGSRGYIQINDDPTVYVVSDELHRTVLEQSIKTWRLTELKVPEEAQARRIAIHVDGQPIEMLRKEGDWHLAPPHAGRVAAGAARALLAAVRQLKLGEFVNDEGDPARYGLDKPQALITIQASGPNAKPTTLRIGNVADINSHTYHATWSVGDEPSRVVFTVMKQARAYLSPRLDELRDPRITPIDQAAFITEVAIRKPGSAPIHLQRESGKGWSFVILPPPAVAPDFKPDQELVASLLEVFATATAKYFVPSAGSPGQPIAVVELHCKAPLIDDTLTLYEPPAGTVPQGEEVPMFLVTRTNKQTGDEGVGYLVPREKLAPALRPVLALRDRQILSLKGDAIDAITLQRYDGATYEFLRTDIPGQLWKLQGEDVFEWPSLRDLFAHVIELKVEHWLNEPAQLGDKVIKLAVREGGREPIVLTVNPASRHATLSSEGAPFVITPETLVMLEQEYRFRAVLPELAGSLAQVTVPWLDDKRMTIGRDELGRYQVLNADGTPLTTQRINPQAAAKIFEGLGPLRVERYITPLNVDWKNETQVLIEVVTKTRVKYTLHLGFPGHENVGLLNGRWFTLSAETLAKIRPIASREKE